MLVVAAAGWMAVLAADWPGHFSPDSIWQLAQGRAGIYDEWHPPVMAWLLGLADQLSSGAGPFMALDAALFFAGLAAIALLGGQPGALAGFLMAAFAASPLVLVYQGDVWKDVLFADAALAGFAALGWALRLWPRAGPRAIALGLSAGLLALAALARQNGWLIAPCAAGLLVARPLLTRAGWRRAALQGAGFVAVVTAIASVGALLLHQSSDGEPQTARQLARLQTYDLAGAARLGLRPGDLERADPTLAQFVETKAAPVWTAQGADNLERLPGAPPRLAPDVAAVGTAWRRFVSGHPWLYLRLRSRVFAATVASDAARGCPTVFVGVDPTAPELLRDAGLAPRRSSRDVWDDDYASAAIGTPVFSHLASLTLLAVAAALAARRLAKAPAAADLVVLGLASAAVLFLASFFVISSACDFRYLYFIDVAAMGAVIGVAAGWRVRRAQRSPRP